MLSPELLDVAAIAIERKTGPVYDLSKDGLGMQCGRVVRASYWKSVGRGLKSCSPMGSSQLRLQYLTLSHIVSHYLDECVSSTSAADCSSCQDYTEEHNEVNSSLCQLYRANRAEKENTQDSTNYKYIGMYDNDGDDYFLRGYSPNFWVGCATESNPRPDPILDHNACFLENTYPLFQTIEQSIPIFKQKLYKCRSNFRPKHLKTDPLVLHISIKFI